MKIDEKKLTFKHLQMMKIDCVGGARTSFVLNLFQINSRHSEEKYECFSCDGVLYHKCLYKFTSMMTNFVICRRKNIIAGTCLVTLTEVNVCACIYFTVARKSYHDTMNTYRIKIWKIFGNVYMSFKQVKQSDSFHRDCF